MATIPVNKMLSSDETTVNKLDLAGGPHDFAFINHKQALVVENNEVGIVTVNLLGDGVLLSNCDGLDPIDLSAGYDFVVPVGATMTLYTTTRAQYLGAHGNNVVVTVNGATGSSFAWLSETS